MMYCGAYQCGQIAVLNLSSAILFRVRMVAIGLMYVDVITCLTVVILKDMQHCWAYNSVFIHAYPLRIQTHFGVYDPVTSCA